MEVDGVGPSTASEGLGTGPGSWSQANVREPSALAVSWNHQVVTVVGAAGEIRAG